MKTFTFWFGSMLSELIRKYTDHLSRTLQHVSMSAAEGQKVTLMTVATLTFMRSDEQFDHFWDMVILKAEELDISEPQLPRRRKLPSRFDDGLSAGEFPPTPKAHFRQAYFEALDLITNCVSSVLSDASRTT